MADLIDLDATAQIQALDGRRVSAADLLEQSIGRWQAQHAQINAIVATDLDRARARARQIDEARLKGESLGPLAGLPMTIKDTFDVDHLPASSGLAALKRVSSSPDALVVARARRAGAVIWGKTNVPVLAGDWQSYNDLYGTTANPWDIERTSGGSSGGAAAALASGATALEIGSDIGGSLRVPAAFCGVYSHKPTWGLVPQRGHIPPARGAYAERDLNVVGPMARSVRDLRLLLSVLVEGPIAAKTSPPALNEIRIGVWLSEGSFPLDPQVRAVVTTFAQQLAAHGAKVQAVRPVDGAALMDAYRLLLMAVLEPDLPPRVRGGLRRLRPIARLAKGLGVGGAWAEQALGYTATHAEWMAADEVRARIGAQVRAVFEGHDVILAPITMVPAFPHDHRPMARRSLTLSDGAKVPYLAMLNWIGLATACGLPPAATTAARSPSPRRSRKRWAASSVRRRCRRLKRTPSSRTRRPRARSRPGRRPRARRFGRRARRPFARCDRRGE
jgi:amidase